MTTAKKLSRKPKKALAAPAEQILDQKTAGLVELMDRVFAQSQEDCDLSTLLEVVETFGISCTRLVTMLKARQQIAESDETRLALETAIQRLLNADREKIEVRNRGADGGFVQLPLPDPDQPAAPPAPLPGNPSE